MFLSEIILLVFSVLFLFVLSLSTIIIMSLQSSCPWSAIASTLSITSFYFISNVSFKSEIFDTEYLKKKKMYRICVVLHCIQLDQSLKRLYSSFLLPKLAPDLTKKCIPLCITSIICTYLWAIIFISS